MTTNIPVPFWLLIIMAIFALVMVLDRILLPGVRWFLRRKVNSIIGDVNDKLSIKIRSFQLTKKQTLVDRLVFDEQVLKAIKEYAEENDMPAEVAQEKAFEYAREIVPKFNAYMYFKFGHWISKTITRLIYRMKVGFYDDGVLRNIDPKCSVVFVMNHRSNMDYIVVSFLVADKTALSYAVGEWARVWPLAILIRSMGAFFVRRNSNNPLYRKVLERYVHYSSRAGVSQAVYPEGGLSKDGIMKPAKLGFLDYILRDYDIDNDRDIVFIPVGLNYDRVIEDRTLERNLKKQQGEKTAKRSKWFVFKTFSGFFFKTLFMNRKKRWLRFGYAGVNFAKPVSAKQYFERLEQPLKDMNKEQRFAQIKMLADDLMQDVAKVVPVLPVALISCVLKEQAGNSMTKEKILALCQQKIEKLKELGAPVKLTENAYEGVLTKTLGLLEGRKIITFEKDHYQVNVENLGLLNYYANSLNHWAD